MNRSTKIAGALLVLALLLQPLWLNYPPASAKWEANPVAQQDSTAETGGADILAADYTPHVEGAIRISVAFATAGTFSLQIKNSAGVVQDVVEFNGATGDLAAAKGYTFVWSVRTNRTYNFQTDTSGDVTLYVEHIRDGNL